MAEKVEVVIKIPEYYLTHPQDYTALAECVRRGTPLPKGHGRIVDVSEIVKTYALEKETNALCGDDDAFIEAIKHAPTIIEADKGEE